MVNELVISDINIHLLNGNKELNGYIDGDRVFFRVPESSLILPGVEPFVAIALLEAMISDRSIVIEGTPISEKLFNQLVEIQLIYSCWNSDLKQISVKADTSSKKQPLPYVGSFFSAGVDSTHTLIRQMAEISHLIMFNAFDHGNDDESWKNRIKKQTKFANSINKTLIPVETNAREWILNRKISWEFVHGLFLSSVGGTFGLNKSYIPSSNTYDHLFPCGSHPLSDPMWSTESTTVIHDGAGFRRGEKMKMILEKKYKIFADNLQTCWVFTHKNCGSCPKCARSIIAAYLLGKEIESVGRYKGENLLKILKAREEVGAVYLEDAMLMAKQTHNRKIYNILKKYYKLYQFHTILSLIDRHLLNNFARNIYRRVKNPNWLDFRVTLRGKNRWEI